MKVAILTALMLIGGTTSAYLLTPATELEQAEAQLEQTAGAKLKDTWPAFRDSLCKDMTGSELNDCRIYQTELFEVQIRLFNESRKATSSGA